MKRESFIALLQESKILLPQADPAQKIKILSALKRAYGAYRSGRHHDAELTPTVMPINTDYLDER